MSACLHQNHLVCSANVIYNCVVLCELLQLLFHMANVCREDNMSVEVNLIMVYSSKDVYAGVKEIN